jgi:predicted nuclease with TOPRIM domain
MMDEENRSLKLQAADLEGKLEAQMAETTQLLDKQTELYAEVQDKLNLLEAFEDKFSRQYRSGLAAPLQLQHETE